MKAYLRSARIAPKKAALAATLVRGMQAEEAITLLEHTNKKSARLVEKLLKSALANASHNEKQDVSQLYVKTIVVNQAQSLRRGVPMARGRMRPMRKFMSHISLELGVRSPGTLEKGKAKTSKKNVAPVSSSPKGKKGTAKKSSESSDSSASSLSS